MRAILLVSAILVAAGCSHDTPAVRGERAFHRLGCTACHTNGPGLAKIIHKQDPKFLERFIANPPAVYQQRGERPINEGYTLMPDMHATPDDARDIVSYLETLNSQGR